MKVQSMFLAVSALSAMSVSGACSGKKPKSSSASALPSTTSVAAVSPAVSSPAASSPASSATSSATRVAAAAAAASSSSSSSSSSSAADGSSGTATFYGGNLSGGTCSFTTLSSIPNGLYGTAFSGAEWDNGAECGACVKVTGPNGNTITAMVVDECPECAEGHFDLFQDAFEQIGDISAGIIDITYEMVDCGITSPLVLHNKSGTSAYYFSMQVVNANEAVSSLEVSTDGGSTWTSTTRQSYNFFEYTSGFGTTTVDVKVTSASGDVITVDSVSCASDSQTTAGSNF